MESSKENIPLDEDHPDEVLFRIYERLNEPLRSIVSSLVNDIENDSKIG